MEKRYYYRKIDKSAYWKVKTKLDDSEIIEITEEEYNEHMAELENN